MADIPAPEAQLELGDLLAQLNQEGSMDVIRRLPNSHDYVARLGRPEGGPAMMVRMNPPSPRVERIMNLVRQRRRIARDSDKLFKQSRIHSRPPQSSSLMATTKSRLRPSLLRLRHLTQQSNNSSLHTRSALSKCPKQLITTSMVCSLLTVSDSLPMMSNEWRIFCEPFLSPMQWLATPR